MTAKQISLIVSFFMLFFSSGTCASPGSDQQDSDYVSMEDFRVLEGDGWDGSLSYLNYGSEKRSSIPVKLRITILNDRTMRFAIQYPGEEQYNDTEKIKISRDGASIDGYRLTARELQSDGTLVLTTEGQEKDDNRPAVIQMVYFISAGDLRIQKNVRFEDDDNAFFNRNEYHFRR